MCGLCAKPPDAACPVIQPSAFCLTHDLVCLAKGIKTPRDVGFLGVLVNVHVLPPPRCDVYTTNRQGASSLTSERGAAGHELDVLGTEEEAMQAAAKARHLLLVRSTQNTRKWTHRWLIRDRTFPGCVECVEDGRGRFSVGDRQRDLEVYSQAQESVLVARGLRYSRMLCSFIESPASKRMLASRWTEGCRSDAPGVRQARRTARMRPISGRTPAPATLRDQDDAAHSRVRRACVKSVRADESGHILVNGDEMKRALDVTRGAKFVSGGGGHQVGILVGDCVDWRIVEDPTP